MLPPPSATFHLGRSPDDTCVPKWRRSGTEHYELGCFAAVERFRACVAPRAVWASRVPAEAAGSF